MPPEPQAATLWVIEEVCRRTAAFAPVLLWGTAAIHSSRRLRCPGTRPGRAAHAAWKWPLRRLAAGSEPRRRQPTRLRPR